MTDLERIDAMPDSAMLSLPYRPLSWSCPACPAEDCPAQARGYWDMGTREEMRACCVVKARELGLEVERERERIL